MTRSNQEPKLIEVIHKVEVLIVYSVSPDGDGPGAPGPDPGEGEIFRSRPDLPRGPTQPPVQCVMRVFPGGKEAGAWCWPPSPI